MNSGATVLKINGAARDAGTGAGGGAEVRLRAVGAPERRSIRRDPPPLDPALIPCDDPLYLRLAEELDFVRRMIDHLGNTLSADGNVIARHGPDLQWFDIASQILGHLASVTRAAFPDAAVDRIGMSELKARLTRRAIDQG